MYLSNQVEIGEKMRASIDLSRREDPMITSIV